MNIVKFSFNYKIFTSKLQENYAICLIAFRFYSSIKWVKKHCSLAIPSQYSYIQQKSEELALNNQELKEKRKKNAAKRKSKDMEGEEENELEDWTK